jgi:hypothetical protein
MNRLIKYFGKNRDTNTLYTLLYAVFSKKYYWYEIKFVYRDKPNGRIILDFKDQCGLKYQDTSLNKRQIKKILSPLHKRNGIKLYLCNGHFDCEVICYLGRFNAPL